MCWVGVRTDEKAPSVLPLGLGCLTSGTGHLLVLPTELLSPLATGDTPRPSTPAPGRASELALGSRVPRPLAMGLGSGMAT